MGWQQQAAQGLPDLTGRTAVVTGANAGLGLHCATQLATAGAGVVLACRNADRAMVARRAIVAHVPGASIDTVRLDLADLASVQSAAQELSAYDIDMLVCNAGLTETRGRQVTVDGFELMMASNYLGHFALVAQLMPTLVSGARIVLVGSIAHRWSRLDLADLQAEHAFVSFRQYGRTKTAAMTFAFELDRRFRASGRPVTALAAHPGFALEVISGGAQPALAAALRPFCQGKDAGAWPLTYAAVARDGGTYVGPAGWQQMTGPPAVGPAGLHTRDVGTATRLWSLSERLSGVVCAV